MKISDDDKRSIIATVKSDAKRKKAETLYNLSPITPEELAIDEETRKASDEFEKEARADNTKDVNEHTIEE